MNENVMALLRRYDARLANWTIVNHSNEEFPSREEQVEHARWMIGQMLRPSEERLADKFKKERTVNRWLGFIQGTLNAQGFYSVKELRDHSRNLYGGKEN